MIRMSLRSLRVVSHLTFCDLYDKKNLPFYTNLTEAQSTMPPNLYWNMHRCYLDQLSSIFAMWFSKWFMTCIRPVIAVSLFCYLRCLQNSFYAAERSESNLNPTWFCRLEDRLSDLVERRTGQSSKQMVGKYQPNIGSRMAAELPSK